jgi:hypothetical protein
MVAAIIVELVIQIMDVHVVKLEKQSQKILMGVELVYQWFVGMTKNKMLAYAILNVLTLAIKE